MSGHSSGQWERDIDDCIDISRTSNGSNLNIFSVADRCHHKLRETNMKANGAPTVHLQTSAICVPAGLGYREYAQGLVEVTTGPSAGRMRTARSLWCAHLVRKACCWPCIESKPMGSPSRLSRSVFESRDDGRGRNKSRSLERPYVWRVSRVPFCDECNVLTRGNFLAVQFVR